MGHPGLEPGTSCVSYKRASQLRQWPEEYLLREFIVRGCTVNLCGMCFFARYNGNA